ncbi:MAG: hypothetical protein ABIO95_06680, partial [Bdellovibrionota bacterium]
QVTMVSMLLLAFVALQALLPFLMSVDLYDLTRAHLYGQRLETCEASPLWPRSLIEVEVACVKIPERYEAKGFLVWNETKIPLGEISYGLWSSL